MKTTTVGEFKKIINHRQVSPLRIAIEKLRPADVLAVPFEEWTANSPKTNPGVMVSNINLANKKKNIPDKFAKVLHNKTVFFFHADALK